VLNKLFTTAFNKNCYLHFLIGMLHEACCTFALVYGCITYCCFESVRYCSCTAVISLRCWLSASCNASTWWSSPASC